jgi:O-antigen/teichoic acid export membrane protein
LLSVGTGVAGQAALLITGVIAARALGVEDRGHFAFIFLVCQVIAQLGSLGVPIALTYFVASEPTRTRRLVASLRRVAALQIIMVVAVQAVVVVALFRSSRSEIKVAAGISLVTGGVLVAQQYGLAVLQGLRRFQAFNLLRLLGPGGYAVASAIAWVLGYRTLVDLTIAFTGAYAIAGVATIVIASRFVLPFDDVRMEGDPSVPHMVRFGLVGLLGASSPIETFKLDQAIVGLFLAPAALGLYVSAVALTNLPRFIAQSIGMVAYPYVARQRNERSRRATMWRFVTLAAVVCGAVVAILEAGLSSLLPLLFGPAFSAAIPVATVLLIAAFLISLRRILSDGARGVGKPGLGTIAELTSLVLLVPSLLISVHFGLVAVGWAMTGCAFVSVGVLLFLLRRSQSETPEHVAPVAVPSRPALESSRSEQEAVVPSEA